MTDRWSAAVPMNLINEIREMVISEREVEDMVQNPELGEFFDACMSSLTAKDFYVPENVLAMKKRLMSGLLYRWIKNYGGTEPRSFALIIKDLFEGDIDAWEARKRLSLI